MIRGKVKFINKKQPIGYIKLFPAYVALYGPDVLFHFSDVLHNLRLNRNDLVEFEVEPKGEKWKAKQIILIERAIGNEPPNAGGTPEEESNPHSSSANFDARRTAERENSNTQAKFGQKFQGNKNNRGNGRLPKQCLVGRIVTLGEKNGWIKPFDELPMGYSKDSLVSFIPNRARSGQLPLVIGDQVSFTLGIKDKTRPLAFGVQLYKGKTRESSVIKEQIDILVNIINGKFAALATEDVDLDDEDIESATKDCMLDILTCEAMWETLGNSPDLSHETLTVLLDAVINLEKKAISMRRSFITILDALARTQLFNPNIGQLRFYVQDVAKTGSDIKLHKVQQLLLLILQHVPDRTHTVISLIKLMIPSDKNSMEQFLFTAMKEIAKQNCCESEDMEWNDMTLVPTSTELTGQHEEYFANLRPVKEKGSYESTHEYLDVYFRLLRADCFGSMCKHVQELCKGKLDYRDMNVYHPVQLQGLSVTATDSGLTVVLKIHSCVPVTNWATTSKLMYGNLLCISPSGTFRDIIWATVAQRDVDMLKQNLIAVELCTVCNQYNDSEALIRMCAASDKMVAVESPTYYNAYKPVLASLQSLTPEELPFQDELISGQYNKSKPRYIQVWINNLAKEIAAMGGTSKDLSDTFFSKLGTSWPSTLDAYQRRALWHIFTHRVACVQGPPGTGKSFIGIIAVRTILKMETRPTGPILVLTYKNHALDEFLKDILEYYPRDVVRIGGRSKEEELIKCNLNEVKGNVRREQSLQESIVDKRGEIERIAFLVRRTIKNLERSLEFSECTLLKYLTRDQLSIFIRECKNKMITKEISDELLSEFEQYHGSIFDFFTESTDRLRILRMAVNQWKPEMTNIERVVPKHLLEFQAKLKERFPEVGTATPDFKKSVEEDESLDEEEIEELHQERFAALGRGGRQNIKDTTIGFRFQKGYSILTTCLDSPEQPDDDNLLFVPNIWKLSADQRQRLIQLLLRIQMFDPLEDFQTDIQYYEQLCAEKKELDDQHKIHVLQSAKVIGMTMTGASLNSHLLKAVKPAIILIEEAAEVLEPQIISVLGPWVQHLIMIGDHKQLRPPVENYELVKQFHLDLSMMERLINNKIPYKSLAIQNRMRPEFATLLTDIYKDLQDGARVHLNVPVNCIEKSMFFWNHTDTEEHARSYTNVREAQRVVKLALFLVQQGYHPSKITILAAYQGQVTLLRQILSEAVNTRKEMFMKYLLEQSESDGKLDGNSNKRLFKVHTIDMYQGDENDIVIISLVRSNAKGAVGFLKTLNRRCVAQSRAKCGMYFCGNASTFSKDPNWSWMINKMKDTDCCDSAISLLCPKHPESQIRAETAADITMQSFCKILCNTRMNCGKHVCAKTCQPPHSHTRCEERVPFKFLLCEHPAIKKCYQKTDEIQCKMTCSKLMDCKVHECVKKCAPQHPHHFCSESVKYNCSKCGNENEKHCSATESSVRCEHEVHFKQPECEHFNTKRCYEPIGKCKKECLRILPDCGHKCSLKCGDKCNPAACKPCRKIREIEEKKREAEFAARKEKFLIDLKKELEEIKTSNRSKEVIQLIRLHEHISEDVLEYNSVKDRVERFIQPEHGIIMKVLSIERVENSKLREDYLKCRHSLIDPTVAEMKFHGTSSEAIQAICQGGFRLPARPGMYGAGIYFATDSSKSERYARESNTLLLCEVALGKAFVAETAMNDMNLAKLLAERCDSLYAKRDTKETRGVLFDEFVIYRPQQAIPKYVIKYETHKVAR